jgi:hypothetical protein
MFKKAMMAVFLLLFILSPLALTRPQQTASITDFKPDPETVLRYNKGYRYPQAGWIVVHVEGEPYERGYQQGRLLPSEIAGYLRCFAQIMNYKAPEEGWKTVRTFANALFQKRFELEILEEMKGIADGASAAGARFDGRPIDLVDIMALNCWSEIESLGAAAAAVPTGLESSLLLKTPPNAEPEPRGEHCSAFAATGPATADGKIVFGHITMFPLYPAGFYNIWLDVQPAKGYRFVMCTSPGGIYSAMDYYINSAGILINETTISQTRFEINGMTCASRARMAIQYGDSIDKVVDYFVKNGNGLYANEWMIADINTNEIALLELGTHKHRLRRSSKNEWFGDTPGFYWGCNNTKEMSIRLETMANEKGRPENLAFRPQGRDLKWQQLYEKYKGKIGVEFAKEAFSDRTLAAPSSLDAKFTTTEMARKMESWALFGPPTGRTWNPSKEDKDRFPEVKPLVSNPWTIITTAAPPSDVGKPAPVLLAVQKGAKTNGMGRGNKGGGNPNVPPAWRGTLLPKTDADLWLAVAFAEFERLVSRERAAALKGAETSPMAGIIEQVKKQYQSVATKLDVPLAQFKMNPKNNDSYNLAASKGVLLLHALRQKVGAKLFDKTMDDFGMINGGQAVSSKQFQEFFERTTDTELNSFFDAWLNQKGLPAEAAVGG